jgi:hypothetical protein
MAELALCVATGYTPDFAEIGDYAAMTVRTYAACQRARVHVEPMLPRGRRPAAWAKIGLLERLLEQGHELVLWIDADAAVVRHDEDARSLLPPGRDLGLVAHRTPEGLVPNTGVLLLRNTGWTRSLLRRVWRQTRYLEHKWWENAALLHVLGYRAVLGEGPDRPERALLAKVAWLPLAWNSLPDLCADPDPVVVHLAGRSRACRLAAMPRLARASAQAALARPGWPVRPFDWWPSRPAVDLSARWPLPPARAVDGASASRMRCR